MARGTLSNPNIQETATVKRSAVVVAAVLAGGLGEAAASGFMVARFGGEHGHPTTDNPTAMYYNPAGLALKGGTRLYLDGTFAYRTASYDRPLAAVTDPGGGTPDDALGANAGKATLFNLAAAPFAGVVSDLGVPGLGVGLGFYVPFGGSAVWDKNEDFRDSPYPGAVDGVQRWWAIEGTIRSAYATTAVAYHIPSLRLSIGLSGNLVLSAVDTIRARNITDGSDDLVFPNGKQKEGRTRLVVDGLDLSIGAGIIWQPADDWWVGVSYQSQPGFGEMHLEGELSSFAPGPNNTEPDVSDVNLVQELPDVIRAGVRWRASPTLELRLFGDYVRWSVLENQCVSTSARCEVAADGSAISGVPVALNIPREWNDAFGVRGGASYWFSPDLELMVGAGWDGSAVPDHTMDPVLMDMPKVTASLGARYEMLDDHMALAFTYTQVFYMEREIDRETYFVTDNGQKVPRYQGVSKTPNLAGTYNQSVGAANLYVEYTF